MKKFTFTFLIAVISVLTAFSQNFLQSGNVIDPTLRSAEAKPNFRVMKSVLFSDDFSTGDKWEIYNTTGDEQNWKIGKIGSQAGNPTYFPVMFTTAMNGAAYFDSWGYDGGKQDAYMVTHGINCSGVDNVRIVFQTYYTKYHDKIYIGVSTDRGENWGLIEVFPDFEEDEETTDGNTAYSYDLDISEFAANQADVSIAFIYRTDNGEGYFWVVDDVKVYKYADPAGPDLYLQATRPEYSMMPVAHATLAPFYINVMNYGYDMTVPGMTISMEVTPGNFSETQQINELLPYYYTDGVYLETGSQNLFRTSEKGNYTYTARVEYAEDDDLTNNEVSFPFEVTENIFATDRNYIMSGIGMNYVGGLGNVYYLWERESINGFYVGFPALSNYQDFTLSIYNVSTGNKVYTSPMFTQSADMENKINFFPIEPQALAAGPYLFTIDQLTATSIEIACDYEVAGGFYIYYSGLDSDLRTGYGNIILRARTGSENMVGIESPEVFNPNVYFNQQTKEITVNLAENALVKVIDLSGRMIDQKNGLANTELKFTQSPGVYIIQVESNGKQQTSKVLVN